MKKADIILLIAIVVVCAVILGVLNANSSSGNSVRIMVDGELVEELEIKKEQQYRVSTAMGENIVVIEGEEVYVLEADCPDKVCVRHKPIKKVGETIICLPHKLVVEIGK